MELSINLDELAFVLHRGPQLKMECFLDRETGAIIYIPTDVSALSAMFNSTFEPELLNINALARDIVHKDTPLLYIPDHFSQNIFELMNTFVGSTTLPENLSKKLIKAIHGSGGYAEFHAILKSDPKQFKKFLNFRDDFYFSKAVEWLKENQIQVKEKS